MAGEYIVPLGIDGDKIASGLNEIISGIDKVEGKAGEAGKSIEDAFGRGAKAADNMDEQLKPTIKNLENIAAAGRQVGKEIGDSLAGKNMKGIDAAIDKIRNRLAEVGKNVTFDIDASKLKIFEQSVAEAKTEIDQLNAVMGFAKDIMAGLDTNSEEYQALAEAVTFSEAAFNEFDQTVDKTVNTNKSLKTELRQIKAALQEMELAGQAGTQQFREMSIRAGELEDQIGDTNAQIRTLASDSKYLDATVSAATGLVGAFALAQGAVGLFGAENEELNAALLKVNSAMAVLQGLQAVAETLNKDSAFSVIFLGSARGAEATATVAQTTATAAHTAAIAAELTATEVLVAAEAQLATATAAATAASIAHTASNTAETAALAASTAAAQAEAAVMFENATAEASAAAAATANAAAQVGQTVAMGGASVAARVLGFALKAIGIGLIIGLIALLVENWDKLTGAINKLLPAGESVGKMFDKIKSYAVGVGNVVFQYLITPFKALASLLQGDFEGFKKAIVDGFSFKKNFTDGFNQSELSNAKAHARELEAERIKADERDLARRKARGEDVTKQELALQKRRIANVEDEGKEKQTEIEKLEDLEDKSFKARADASKKAADEAKKLREEADKKRLEEEKKNQDAITKYTREAADIRINGIANDLERERARITEDYRRKIEDLKKEGATSADAQKKLAELSVALIAERDKKIKDAEVKSGKEKLKLQMDAQQALQDLAKQGTDRDLKLLELDHNKRKADIEEQYKDEADLKAQLLVALDASTARERKKISDDAAAKQLQDEEERQLLAIELAGKYALKNEETERQKQIAIYETKIEFAQKTLDALTAGGLGETNLQVLQAKAQLKALRDGLQSELKSGSQKPFSFMEFIGLGKLDDDQKAAVQKAGAQAAEALGQITDFIVDQYQRQIDKKQESIDQLDDEIGDLEEKLDEEKELRDNGFANNVELIEAELAEKQRQKDEEVKQQEELMKKKQAMQKAQMAVDTAVQLVNMITASTEIFKALAGIPFIGIPLAIATIGTMFGAFVVAKVKAAQGISSQSFGEGGWIDGKSHAEGGKKYYSADGDVRELEKDEFVVKRKQAKKFSNILEAINNNSFTGFDVNDAGLKEMLNSMGIDLAEDSAKAGLDEANKLGNMKLSITVNNSSNDREMREMNANIKFLADREREKVTTWEDDKYFYSKIGSRTTKVPKHQKPKEVADATS